MLPTGFKKWTVYPADNGKTIIALNDRPVAEAKPFPHQDGWEWRYKNSFVWSDGSSLEDCAFQIQSGWNRRSIERRQESLSRDDGHEFERD